MKKSEKRLDRYSFPPLSEALKEVNQDIAVVEVQNKFFDSFQYFCSRHSNLTLRNLCLFLVCGC